MFQRGTITIPMGNRQEATAPMKTKNKTLAASLAASLAALAAVLRFALRGYDVVALILLVAAALVVLWAFVGGLAFKVAVGAVGVVALAVAVTEVPIVANSKTDANDGVEYVVVLGARVDESGNPSYSLLWRLEATLEYLNAHPDATAVLSGGQGADKPMSEAACMHDWLVGHGVDEDRLIMEDQSTNTLENLRNSFAILGQRTGGDDLSGKVAVVSSSYHLFRAKLIASGLGVDVSGVAAFPGNPVVTLNYFIREAPAVWKQLLLNATSAN